MAAFVLLAAAAGARLVPAHLPVASADGPNKNHLFRAGFALARGSRAVPQTANSDLMFCIGGLGDAKSARNICLRLGGQPASRRGMWNIYFAWGLRHLL